MTIKLTHSNWNELYGARAKVTKRQNGSPSIESLSKRARKM